MPSVYVWLDKMGMARRLPIEKKLSTSSWSLSHSTMDGIRAEYHKTIIKQHPWNPRMVNKKFGSYGEKAPWMGAKKSECGREATTTIKATVGASARSLSFSAGFILLFSPRRYQNTNSLRTYISCVLLPSIPPSPACQPASPLARQENFQQKHMKRIICLCAS